jgi:hypothetical protein
MPHAVRRPLFKPSLPQSHVLAAVGGSTYKHLGMTASTNVPLQCPFPKLDVHAPIFLQLDSLMNNSIHDNSWYREPTDREG